MRPPNKSRSRNKNNRRGGGQNLGNALNRVYESAGPEGKVRGTPVQVIEKYQALAHDSSLAGDRVATENFQQHAEHYIRLINDVQRQLAEQREAQQAQQQQHQGNGNGNGRGQHQGNGKGQPQQNGAEQPQPQPEPQADAAPSEAGGEKAGKDEALSVLGDNSDGDQPSGLVETPEAAASEPEPKDPPKRRRSRSRNAASNGEESGSAPDTPAE